MRKLRFQKVTEHAPAHEASERLGFECPPGLLALLQECFLVGCVNLEQATWSPCVTDTLRQWPQTTFGNSERSVPGLGQAEGHSKLLILQLSSEVAFTEHRRWCCMVLCLIQKALPDVQLKATTFSFLNTSLPLSCFQRQCWSHSISCPGHQPPTLAKRLKTPAPLERCHIRHGNEKDKWHENVTLEFYPKPEKSDLRECSLDSPPPNPESKL